MEGVPAQPQVWVRPSRARVQAELGLRGPVHLNFQENLPDVSYLKVKGAA